MTFNDNARINPHKVSRRGRNTGIAVGGGGTLHVIGLFIVSQFLGVDLTGLAGGGSTGGEQTQDQALYRPDEHRMRRSDERERPVLLPARRNHLRGHRVL